MIRSNVMCCQVPCSRSDVFSSKVVSMMEKRKMMKFLTFCSDFQSHPEQYQGTILPPPPPPSISPCFILPLFCPVSMALPKMSLSVEFVSLSFEDYLKQNKLTPNLVNYIHHSIAMVTNTATTLEVQHTHTHTHTHTREHSYML